MDRSISSRSPLTLDYTVTVIPRRTFAAKRDYPFPSTAAKTEWTRVSRAALPERVEDAEGLTGFTYVPVSLEEQLYRWLRTEAFRTLNSGFSFAPRDADDLDDRYTVEEISLAFHLRELVQAKADNPAVVSRRYVAASAEDLDPEFADILAGGFIQVDEIVTPGISRSGIKLTSEETKRKDENAGLFNFDDLTGKCLRAARFALEVWDREYIAKLSTSGAKGGRTSKRGPKYTVDMLDGLKPLERANPWAVAKRLGCSEQVARRLIKEASA